LHFGFDVGRSHDLSVLSVIETSGNEKLVRAILRMENMRLPDQQRRLAELFSITQLRGGAIDMTGIGLGLTEYSQDEFGKHRIQGINFSSSVPITDEIAAEGRKTPTVKITEAMAVKLLRCYEDRSIKHPCDVALRDDLRKPERVVSPGGRVSIAAVRDAKDHADHFWSFCLGIWSGINGRPCGPIIVPDGKREHVIADRRERMVVA
jgi:phage FluMu gp28-like protein